MSQTADPKQRVMHSHAPTGQIPKSHSYKQLASGSDHTRTSPARRVSRSSTERHSRKSDVPSSPVSGTSRKSRGVQNRHAAAFAIPNLPSDAIPVSPTIESTNQTTRPATFNQKSDTTLKDNVQQSINSRTDTTPVPPSGINKPTASINSNAIPIGKASLPDTGIISHTVPENLFPWYNVGEFHASGSGVPDVKDSKVIKAYILENFYNDLYVNGAGVVGTCFFAWAFAYVGMSWWSIGFVFFCTTAVYNNEYRRFNRNVRDDLKRTTVAETIGENSETTNWLNNFLSKFWVIYMPELSKQVKDIANPILAGISPGYGIDGISLDEFTLGSKAPSIKGVKAYSKQSKTIVTMDFPIEFTPSDTSDMTLKQIKQKINPKVSLGVIIGAGVISKSMSVIVEDINFSGKLRVAFEFGRVFPNIKIVSLQLLEPPLIDFSLKPIGGDALGLDVMSFLPGLKTTVQSVINATLEPMFYAPNKMDINVEDIMAAQSNDATGVLAITLHQASGFKNAGFITNTIDPYITINTEYGDQNNIPAVKSSIKSDTLTPVWNETQYVLVNNLQQKLLVKCFDFNDVRKDTLLGEIEIPMEEIFEGESLDRIVTPFTIGTKTRGELVYSLRWLPCVEKLSEDVKQTREAVEGDPGTTQIQTHVEAEEQAAESIDIGILRFTLQNVKYLSTSSSATGTISPSAALFVDGKLVKEYRTLRRLNEPSWNETSEIFIPSKLSSNVKICVYDESSGKKVICQYESSLGEILDAIATGENYLKGTPQGEIFVDAQWKPVKVSDDFTIESTGSGIASADPIGSVKLYIKEANIVGSLAGVGDIDPYFTVSMNNHLKYRSHYIPDTKKPIFNKLVHLPVLSPNFNYVINLYDYQGVGTHRFIGACKVSSNDLLFKDEQTGEYRPASKHSQLLKVPLLDKHDKPTGSTLDMLVHFVPVMPVYSPDELEDIKQKELALEEKRRAFDEEQLELKKKMEAKPKLYEMVEIDDPFTVDKGKTAKQQLDLQQLLQHNSGVLMMNILGGHLQKSNGYIHFIFDDFTYPNYSSSRSHGKALNMETGSAFIRDLNNSVIHVLVSKKPVLEEESDILARDKFQTKNILKSSYLNPTEIRVGESSIKLRTTYNPTASSLPGSDSVLDTGYCHLKLISGEGLMAADRNGKSDPFIVVSVDGKDVYKTEIVKKSLNPVWNESTKIAVPSRKHSKIALHVFDWDRAGTNDPLGDAYVDLYKIKPKSEYSWDLPLSTQGHIKVKGLFAPGYIEAGLQTVNKPTGIAAAPLKAVGGVTQTAAGGFQFGGKLLKKGLNITSSKHDTSNTPVAAPNQSYEREVAPQRRSSSRKVSQSNAANMHSSNHSTPQPHQNEFDPSVPNQDYTEMPANNFAKPVMESNDSATGIKTNAAIASNGSAKISRRSPSIASHNMLAAGPTGAAAATTAATIPPGVYKGKVTILAAENVAKNLQIKISIAHGGKMKPLFVTNTIKADDDGLTKFDEDHVFEASSESAMVFDAVAHHKFSKDKDVGVAQINLTDPHVQQGKKLALKLGEGRIIIRLEYASEYM